MKLFKLVACSVSLMAIAGSAHAAIITGPADPNYTTVFQGASAATFAGLGFTIGTGATDLKVHTEVWSDPSGFGLGSMLPGSEHLTASGTITNKLCLGCYTIDGVTSTAAGNLRDYNWVQNAGTNFTTTAANDQPWLGSIWDLGGQANQAVVFPIIDHDPLPQEALEYTVYLTNNPLSTNLADWSLALLDAVFLQGWEADGTAIADGFTTVWKLSTAATFRYVSVQAIGSQALQPIFGNEDEIDAVAGLTREGGGVVGVPEPGTLTLLSVGLAGMFFGRRRKARS